MPARQHPPRPAPTSADADPAANSPPEGDNLGRSEDEVDESLEESFPASDPPSWAALSRIGTPKRKPES